MPRPRPSGFAQDQRGSIALLTAASGAVLIGSAALAVDLGSVYLQARRLQGIADLAALAAARDLAGAGRAAQATADSNDWPGTVIARTTLGRYDADKSKAVNQRFVAGAPSANAARVRLEAEADVAFGRFILGKPSVTIHREATAATAEMASFSIGTRLASLQGGVANALLSALAGGNVSLSVMDYNALAAADVELFEFVDALRTHVGVETGSFDEVLAADVKTPQALKALAEVLNRSGRTQAAAAVAKVALAVDQTAEVKLSSLIDLGPIGAQDRVVAVRAASAYVSALDLAKATLLTAQEDRQVRLDLDSALPGVANVEAFLAIGERPNDSSWLTIDGTGGVVVRTNQARLYLRAQTLSALGILGAKPVTLPLVVELASGEAKLAAMRCAGPAASHRVTLDVRPSLGKVSIGDVQTSRLNDFKRELTIDPGVIVDVPPLLKVTGIAQAQLGGDAWKRVEFSRAEVDSRIVKSVKTTDLTQATLSSLISRTQLTVKLTGLTLPIDLTVLSILNTLAAPLDGLINSLTDLLGVRLGEADVRVNGLRCRDAVLVA